MEQLKLIDLYTACKKLVKEGHGEKRLVISSDNEGEELRGMCFSLTPVTADNADEYKKRIYDNVENNLYNIVIVG